MGDDSPGTVGLLDRGGWSCQAVECPGVVGACCVEERAAMGLKGTQRPASKLEAAHNLLCYKLR